MRSVLYHGQVLNNEHHDTQITHTDLGYIRGKFRLAKPRRGNCRLPSQNANLPILSLYPQLSVSPDTALPEHTFDSSSTLLTLLLEFIRLLFRITRALLR